MNDLSSESSATLAKLFERVEWLCQQNQQLQSQVAELVQEVTDLRMLLQAETREEITNQTRSAADANTAPFPDHPPTESVFYGQISDYEPGILFDEAAFDLTLRFDDGQGMQLARQWGFQDAGHLLAALLESCLLRLAANMDLEELVFRRDIDSATVYARERPILEEALQRMLWAGASPTTIVELIQRLSPESRRRE